MRLDLVLEPDSPARFRELGLLAESLGFGNVWTANHIAARDPFMSFMPLAEASQRIGIGPIAVSPFELHPVKIANQLGVLNELAPGRAKVVIGGGGGTVIGLGMKPGRRTMMPRMVRAVREAVEIVRGACSGQLCNYDGEIYEAHGYRASWAASPPPALYIGASKPQMLRLAGRLGDGVMMSDVTVPRIVESMTALGEGLARREGTVSDYPVSNLYALHLRDDAAEARAEARAKLFVRGMLERWYISPFLDDVDCDRVEAAFPAFARAYALNSPDIEGVPDALVDALVDNLTWTGTPADIDRFLEEMVAFRDAGVTELAVRLYGEPEAAIRLLADRVMPALAGE